MPETGEELEPFVLETLDGSLQVPDPAGRRTVLMFFQEANTPLCSSQVVSINDEAALLQELQAIAVCISTDPVPVLAGFRRQAALTGIALVSDHDGELSQRFGVFDRASGRAQRAAFVIDGNAVVTHANHWYNPMNSEQLADVFEALGLKAG